MRNGAAAPCASRIYVLAIEDCLDLIFAIPIQRVVWLAHR